MSISIEHNRQTGDVNMNMTTEEFLGMFWVIMGKVRPDELNSQDRGITHKYATLGERSLKEAIGQSMDLLDGFEAEAHQAYIKEAIAEVENIINQNLEDKNNS